MEILPILYSINKTPSYSFDYTMHSYIVCILHNTYNLIYTKLRGSRQMIISVAEYFQPLTLHPHHNVK